MSFHVYILRCANGAFYVGYTENLEGRFEAHNAGRGSTYTRRNGPVTLVHSELHDTELDAMRREQQLKRWSRAKKQALIDSNMARLRPRRGRNRSGNASWSTIPQPPASSALGVYQ